MNFLKEREVAQIRHEELFPSLRMSDEELVEVQLGGRRYLVGRLMGEGHLKELDGFLGEGGIEVGQQAEFSLVKVFPAVRTVTGYESLV